MSLLEQNWNPSIEIQLEAVRQNGHAIKYIKNPSLEVQLEAVKEHGNAIKHIENPTLEVLLESKINEPKRLLLTRDWIFKDCTKIGCKQHTKEEWIQYLPSYVLQYSLTKEELEVIINYLGLE